MTDNNAAGEDPVTAEGTQDMAVDAFAPPAPYEIFGNDICVVEEKEGADPLFVCSVLRVSASFSDIDGKGWGKLVSVRTRDGNWHDVPIKSEDLHCSPRAVIGSLVNHGLEIGAGKKAADHVVSLLRSWTPSSKLISASRGGWVDETRSSFVMADKVFGAQDVLALPQTSQGPAAHLGAKGSIDEWKQSVGSKCVDNPLMQLAVSLAFSGPLLPMASVEGLGLHFRGMSSSGKTTLLRVAASVWGRPQLITQWRATSNGLEAIAASLNNMLLPLDEIAEVSAKDLPNTIYMLANGLGKARMKRDTSIQEPSRWNLAVISSGEIGIEEKLAEARVRLMEGQEVRLVDIDADCRNFGAFDTLHGATNAADFADSLKSAAESTYGTVGQEFARKLSCARGNIPQIISTHARAFKDIATKGMNPLDAVAARVLHRFSVLSIAGELATAFGLTGWQRGDSRNAALSAFADWHEGRVEDESVAVSDYVDPLLAFIDGHMSSFAEIGSVDVGETPRGLRDDRHVYLSKETWHEVFPGVKASEAAKALIKASLLAPGEQGRHLKKLPRAASRRTRMYAVLYPGLKEWKAAL